MSQEQPTTAPREVATLLKEARTLMQRVFDASAAKPAARMRVLGLRYVQVIGRGGAGVQWVVDAGCSDWGDVETFEGDWKGPQCKPETLLKEAEKLAEHVVSQWAWGGP